MTARSEELSANLAAVRERLVRAAGVAERDPDAITLTVVTKFFPVSDVRILADLGVRHVGENRHQEAEEKAAAVTDLDLVWHFIGHLQSNKASAVARYADVVESVDRRKLLRGLGGDVAREKPVDVLVQVSLDGPDASGRSGADPHLVPELADAVAQTEGLRLRGLMAVAPLGGDPTEAFARLAEVAAELRASHPGADWLSAGMSADLEEAVAAGATHVRIGSAVLGPRPAIK